MQQGRGQVVTVLKRLLEKKTLEVRRERYRKRQEELVQKCRTCSGGRRNGSWYCEDCVTGQKLHWLDSEYSDINDWWKNRSF